jgi:1-acyl-sn-glycerol-3-phosphate acyltransferase
MIDTGYFSLAVEGAAHVPRRGPAIYVANHAGWFTLDTLMAALALVDHVGADRLPYGAVQDQLLAVPAVGRFFERIGGFPASWMRDPRSLPAQMESFSVYPEGTEGNCKPFWHAYRMRRWRTGFAHLAAARGAPIVPLAVLGGEECLPVAYTLRFLQPLVGTILPVPLLALPLPARWKVVFHEPVRFHDGSPGDREGSPGWMVRRARRVANSIRATVQRTLDREAEHRLLGRLSRRLHGVDGEAEAIAFPDVARDEVQPTARHQDSGASP